eukprot:2156681-Alexandrium_andersonii.AAC.1
MLRPTHTALSGGIEPAEKLPETALCGSRRFWTVFGVLLRLKAVSGTFRKWSKVPETAYTPPTRP